MLNSNLGNYVFADMFQKQITNMLVNEYKIPYIKVYIIPIILILIHKSLWLELSTWKTIT